MKTIPKFLLILQLVLLGFSSCSDDETCTITAESQTMGETILEFTAVPTGDGTISTLTYTVGDKDTTVTSPELPWNSILIIVEDGTRCAITAKGKVKNGSLSVSCIGNGEILASQSCPMDIP